MKPEGLPLPWRGKQTQRSVPPELLVCRDSQADTLVSLTEENKQSGHTAGPTALCPQSETQSCLHTRMRRSTKGHRGDREHHTQHTARLTATPGVLPTAPPSQGAHSAVLSQNQEATEEWASPGCETEEPVPEDKGHSHYIPLVSEQPPRSTGGPLWAQHSPPKAKDSVSVCPMTLSPRTGRPLSPSTYPLH